MSVTIRNVAERAKVSVGTVSRVLNDYPDVQVALRERVEAAIRDLNFRPNVRAQSLSRASSPILSFVLSNRDLLHPFHSRILRAVSEECERSGHFVLYSMFRYAPDTPGAQLELPAVFRTHGIAECVILAGTNYPNLLQSLDENSIKYVLLANNYVSDQPRPAVDQVRFDEVRGAYDATKYLIQLGHRMIWYVGDISVPWNRNRYEGYSIAIQESGLTLNAQTVGLAEEAYDNGFRSAEMILDQKCPMTAIFAATDDVARGVAEALQCRVLTIPADVSVVGFDDQPSPYSSLELTTVRVEAEEIGRQLARMAIAKIQSPGRVFPEVVIPTTLVKRRTARPILGQMPRVSEPKVS